MLWALVYCPQKRRSYPTISEKGLEFEMINTLKNYDLVIVAFSVFFP
jgi:hypothetical protein